MQRIVVCCDGTWNTAGQNDGGVPTPTNVIRLYNAVADADGSGNTQHRYYHPGVGTDPSLFSRVAGGGLGLGLDRNIMSGYRSVCDNYADGDEIYLFGFSRGAYTVRSLGGFIGCCGLLDLRGVAEGEAWARIEKLFEEGYRKRDGSAVARMMQQGARFHAPPAGQEKIPIRFIGVWDTVGALGVPDHLGVLNLIDNPEDHRFNDTTLGDSVQTARHAVALDEFRASFQPTLWTEVDPARDVKQLWFPGAHSDVGGGYKETGLSDGALRWMIDEARACGLAFRPKLLDQVRPDHHAVLHDSLDGVFALMPSQPRSAPCFPGSKELHVSALLRHEDPPITQMPYRPTRVLPNPGDCVTVDVFANRPWNDIGLYLEAGASYELQAEGEWLDKDIPTGPEGTKDGKFHLGEVAHVVGSAIGRLESLFKALGGSEKADFVGTRRHEKIDWFCLVGAIANGTGVNQRHELQEHETKAIGKGCRWKPKKSGYLYAYANDAWHFYDNNRGRVRLTVTRV